MKRAEMTVWPANGCAHTTEPSDLRGGAVFDLTLLSLLGVVALGLRHELAIGLWVTMLGVVVHRLRSRCREPIPRAQLVLSRFDARS